MVQFDFTNNLETAVNDMEQLRKYIDHMGPYAAALLKWIVVGGLVGGVGGVVGALFHLGVNYATSVRLAHPWVLYLLPLGGLVIAGLYRLCKLEGKGTNAVIESVHFGSDVPVLLVPLIFVSTVITHLCGGSAGREGAALQIGGGIGYRTGRLLHLGEKDLPLATLCGMSGVFSALFGTPLTATVFALEVISVGVLYYAGLVPCITAAMISHLPAAGRAPHPLHRGHAGAGCVDDAAGAGAGHPLRTSEHPVLPRPAHHGASGGPSGKEQLPPGGGGRRGHHRPDPAAGHHGL